MKKYSKKYRKLKWIILFTIFTLVFSVLFLSRSKEITLINVKTIPKNADTFMIIDPIKIGSDFSSYFMKNPSDLIKLFNETDELKDEYIHLELDYNEPIAFFWVDSLSIIGLHCSTKDQLNIESFNPDFLNVQTKTIEDRVYFIDNNNGTLFHSDPDRNQIRIYFSPNKSISLELIDNYIIKVNDSSTYNKLALNHYKNENKSIIFFTNNPYLNNKIGMNNALGSISFNQSTLSVNMTGQKEKSFIFKDNHPLIALNNGWINGSFNFNNKNTIINNQIYSQILDSNWNGISSFSIFKISNYKELLMTRNPKNSLKHMDLQVLLGFDSANSMSDTIINSIGKFIYNKENSGYFYANNSSNIKAKSLKNNYCFVKLDAQKIIESKNEEWIWQTIKMSLQKWNIKSVTINCNPIGNKEFELKAIVEALDSNQHLILSPMIN